MSIKGIQVLGVVVSLDLFLQGLCIKEKEERGEDKPSRVGE